MTARKRTGWLAMPRVRRMLARILVVAGAALALVGLLTARYGFLLAGILVVGLGAAFGPARIRRRD
jgi:hypothetical protein